MLLVFSVLASSILSAGLILPVLLLHIEKDAEKKRSVELEKAFEGTGKPVVMGCEEQVVYYFSACERGLSRYVIDIC